MLLIALLVASCGGDPQCTTFRPNAPNHGGAQCGNARVENTEACDDGNKSSNDGCSSTCTVEPGYVCAGSVSVCTGGGIEALTLALTINSITVATPAFDWRGKNCSTTALGGVSEGCSLSSGQTMTRSGSANVTYAAAAGTNGTIDKGVTFVGTANGDGYFTGVAGDGEIGTEDFVIETIRKNGNRASPHMIFAKLDAAGVQGFRVWDTTTNKLELITGSTTTALSPNYTTSGTGKWEYCTECADRSSATGGTIFCNGQAAISGTDISARSGTLVNTTTVGVGGTNDSGTHFVYNGTISLVRMYPRAAWFSSAQAECETAHRARLRVLSAKRYLHIGDSTTQGVTDTNPIIKWPALYGESGTALTADINAGKSGQRCDQMITDQWAVEKLMGGPATLYGYSRLFLLCGINDINADHAAATIEADITTIVSQAKALGMDVTLITPMPDGNGASWSAPRQVVQDALNVWILANNVGATRVVNLYAAMENTPGSHTLAAAFDSGDGLHPNQAGHTQMAATIAAAVAP